MQRPGSGDQNRAPTPDDDAETNYAPGVLTGPGAGGVGILQQRAAVISHRLSTAMGRTSTGGDQPKTVRKATDVGGTSRAR